MTHDDTARNGTVAASNATSTTADEDRSGVVSRRRLIGGMGTAAVAGLAGCSGILGGGGGGGPPDNVHNEVEEVAVTGTSGEANEEDYRVTLTMDNTGGEEVEVFDLDYQLTLYDESDSEIQVLGSITTVRDEFGDDGAATVEIQPTIRVEPSTVASYEVRVVCEEGPYCE